jgi:putative peptide zinc metalloprotease protein
VDPSSDAPESDGDTTAASEPWIFPLDEPLAPDEGDTQALAVNTTDGTATYDVAFALVWADGDEPADNTNEAYALASCDNCAAIAVAFQVVLVVGEADVAVPQNVSVALNYDCTSCLTYSLAVQLFVTLDGPLSDEAMAALDELWAQVMAFGAGIGQVPLDEIQGQLAEFEGQILAVIEADQGPLTDTAESPSAIPSDGASPTAPTESPTEATESPTAPTESPTEAAESPSDSASSEPTGSPSPTSSVSPSPSTSPSSTTEPTTEPSPTEPTASSSPSSTP